MRTASPKSTVKSMSAAAVTLFTCAALVSLSASPVSATQISPPKALVTDVGQSDEWGVANCGIVNCTWYLNRHTTHKLHAGVQTEKANLERYGTWFAEGAGFSCAILGGMISFTAGSLVGPLTAAGGGIMGGAAADKFCAALSKDSLNSFTQHLSDADRANQCFAVRAGATPQFLVRSNSYCKD